MPVQKFRSVEEMKKCSQWLHPGDPRLVRRMRILCGLSAAVGPLRAPRGVQKFRSAEEAEAERRGRESERIERLREERRKN